MTKSEINTRLILYVVAAMLTVASTDIGRMRDADFVGWIEFVIKIALSGVITWRAFIDKSVVVDAGSAAIHDAIEAAKSKASKLKLPLSLIGAAGILAFLPGCTTPPVKIPLISADRYGSLTLYAVIGYQAPAAATEEINLWHADAPPTLNDK